MKILEAIPRINLVKSREPSAQVFPPNFSTRSDTRSDKFYIYMYITKRLRKKEFFVCRFSATRCSLVAERRSKIRADISQSIPYVPFYTRGKSMEVGWVS